MLADTPVRPTTEPDPDPNVQAESLVVIRTYPNLMRADEAHIELMHAGINALVLSSGGQSHDASDSAVALAVHRRDAEIAEAVLSASAEIP